MEVKGGRQTLTHRVRKQILVDQRLKREGKVNDVKWVLYERKTGDASTELQDFIKSCGLQLEVRQLPKGF